MNAIERILCPVDFSETSEEAFRFAESLAAKTGSELVLLHVYDLPDFWESGGQQHTVDPELKEQLLSIRPTADQVKVDYVLHAGQSGEVICWLAQERDCDLIVIGTHGRTGLMHLLMGSVAEYVVRHARCPVLTIRKRPENEPPLPEPEVHAPMPPMM